MKNDRMKVSSNGKPYASVCSQSPEGLILLPQDIYLAAQKLGMKPEVLYQKYCSLQLQPSNYFWVGLKSVKGHCPLHCNGQCRLEDAKPRLCKSYPILDVSNPLDSSEHSYSQFLEPDDRYCDAPYTVEEWLINRGVDLEDPDAKRYYEVLGT